MSAYLELQEEKNKLGIISDNFFSSQTKFYNGIRSEKTKESYDNGAKRELIRIKANATLYLNAIQIGEIKEGNRKLDNIKGWVTFFGILQIVSIVAVVIYLMNLCYFSVP